MFKETSYLLLGNGTDIYDTKHKTRLGNAMAMNEPLSKAYYPKEQLRGIWAQACKEDAEKVLSDWANQAMESKIPQLQKMNMPHIGLQKRNTAMV